MKGKVYSVNIGEVKGIPKRSVEVIRLIKDKGVEGLSCRQRYNKASEYFIMGTNAGGIFLL